MEESDSFNTACALVDYGRCKVSGQDLDPARPPRPTTESPPPPLEGAALLPHVEEDQDLDDLVRGVGAPVITLIQAVKWYSHILEGLFYGGDPGYRDRVLGALVQDYVKWRDDARYLIFEALGGKPKRFGVLASKRGNSVYDARIHERLDPLHSYFADYVQSIDPHLNIGSVVKTRCLFVTFTIDPSYCSMMDSWDVAPKEFDRAMKSIRKVYPCIWVRSFQAHHEENKGYCHVHALILFESKEWEAIKHLSKKGKVTWRLRDYHDKTAVFSDRWKVGYADVQAVFDGKKGLDYVLKYVYKPDLLSSALLWITRTRSYGVSDLDLIRLCVSHTKIYQAYFEDGKIEKKLLENCFCLGVLSIEFKGDGGKDPPWFINLDVSKKTWKNCFAVLRDSEEYSRRYKDRLLKEAGSYNER